MREYMKRDALDAVGSSPEGLGKMLESEIAKYSKVIQKGNIQMP